MPPPEPDMPEPQPQPINLPREIGGYKIQRLLGAGGMATVYAALQKQPRRIIALKVMKPGVNVDRALRRFKREIEILGRLRHPFIAQVYHAGIHNDGTGDVPFFVMEYVPNAKTILEYADAKSLDDRERLKLFVKVCAAVEHGHQHKVIHRDLKPGNILIDDHGEVKIIDFGVARATEVDFSSPTMHTEEGRLVGTIQYMSPEQLDATPQDLDTRTDVYSLGVVVYQILTGRMPHNFAGLPLHEVTRIIREWAPIRPGDVRADLKGDLETIVLKALAKDRRHRYRTAGSLGRDIVRYLADKPINARRTSRWHRLRLFARRHRTALTAGVVVAGVLLAAAAIVLYVTLRPTPREREYRSQLEKERAAMREMEQRLRDGEATATPDETAGLAPFRLEGHLGRIEHLAFDPTGGRLASIGSDRVLVIWDLDSREELLRLREHDQPVEHLCFSADGTTIATAAEDGTIVVLDARTGDIRRRFQRDGERVNCLALSPDGARIAFGAEDLTLRVRPVQRGGEEQTIRGTRGAFLSAAFSPDGTRLLGGAQRDAVYLWDAQSGETVRRLQGLRGSIIGVGFSADGARACAVGADGSAMMWDLEAEDETGTPFAACSGGPACVRFDPAGRRLVCATHSEVNLRDLTTGEPLRRPYQSDLVVYCAAIGADGLYYAVGRAGGEIDVRPVAFEEAAP